MITSLENCILISQNIFADRIVSVPTVYHTQTWDGPSMARYKSEEFHYTNDLLCMQARFNEDKTDGHCPKATVQCAQCTRTF